MTTATTAGAPGADDLDLELEEVTSGEQGEKPNTVPDKYKGKTVEDLISMHQNAERALSRQGNEAGELRRLADAIIIGQTQKNNATREQPKPVTVEALLDNPDKALNEALERSPVATRTAATEARLDRLEGQISMQDFVGKHPNYAQEAASPDFLKWVQKNTLRSNLAQRADKHDYQAAQSLFDLWDEYKELAGNEARENTQKERQDKLNKVRTARNGASEGRPVAKYSRAKLMALRMRVQDGDPAAVAKWNDPQFQADMLQAYQEKRVH